MSSRIAEIERDAQALAQGAKRALEREVWEPRNTWDGEEGGEVRSTGLGSFLNPSGKYYLPWACSNLNPCETCNGTGNATKRSKRALCARLAKQSAAKRERALARKQADGRPDMRLWRAAWLLDQRRARYERDCVACGGTGCREAHLDEVWSEALESAASALGISIEASEGDPCYLIACEYRDASESEENESEAESEASEVHNA